MQREATTGRKIGIEVAFAVLGERRMIRHGIVDDEPDEPAEQQVAVDLLDHLPLGTHRVERLHQRGPEQPLRRDRRDGGLRIVAHEEG